MSSPILFVIVGKNEPLFEAEVDTTAQGAPSGNDLSTRQNYFVLHSAIDLVEKSAWTTNNMYLRVVDKVCSWFRLCSSFALVGMQRRNECHTTSQRQRPIWSFLNS